MPETIIGNVLRSPLRLSFYKWRMVSEWCYEEFRIDAQEYQQVTKYYLDNHGVTILADRAQTLSDCVETYGTEIAERGKGVGKGPLYKRAKQQPGYESKEKDADYHVCTTLLYSTVMHYL